MTAPATTEPDRPLKQGDIDGRNSTPNVALPERSSIELTIRALGTVAMKGSKSPKGHLPNGRCILAESDKDLPAWTKAVQAAASNARLAHGWLLLTDACEVSIEFWLVRPKTVTREYPTGLQDGDVDKMVRATLDAMSGIVYADDKLVVHMGDVWKRYADGQHRPGARIRVRSVASQLAVI